MKKNKKVFAVIAAVITAAMAIVIPVSAAVTHIGTPLSYNDLMSAAVGIEAQKTLQGTPYVFLALSCRDEVGDGMYTYYLYAATTGSLNNTSTGLSVKGGRVTSDTPSATVYMTEYDPYKGYSKTITYKGIGYAQMQSNEIIVLGKYGDSWQVNTNNAAKDYIGLINFPATSMTAWERWKWALDGYNGTTQNTQETARSEGYANGYSIGYNEGNTEGYNNAMDYFNRVITNRTDQAYNQGYNLGYAHGVDDAQDGGVKAYTIDIASIITSYAQSVRTIIDGSLQGLTIGGIELLPLLIAIIVLALAIFALGVAWKWMK